MAELYNASTGALLSNNVKRATTPWQRTVGFLRQARINPGTGLWFDRCRAIHTLGMRSALDLIFLDHAGIVVGIEAGVRPNRACVSSRGARAILEMGPGFLSAVRLDIGDQLVLRPAGATTIANSVRKTAATR